LRIETDRLLLKEGILKHFAKVDGCYYDIVYYGIVRADYDKLA
jgi:hypothetical protein